MLNLIVIALALTTGNPGKQAPTHMTVVERADGTRVTHFGNAGSVIGKHNRPWERGEFVADEGADGVAPAVIRKHF